ncbi:hypothetical protein, partial [Staphylococcus haemolyticus]|uniref:hypothetical protein n=1 Tax=Staphylococcus haemolyticus TaxID=1283 RepID=UPI001C92FCD4
LTQFFPHHTHFQNLQTTTKQTIQKQLSYFIQHLKSNPQLIPPTHTNPHHTIISQYPITTLNFKPKITKHYQSIIPLFSSKIIINNYLINLPFLNQY